MLEVKVKMQTVVQQIVHRKEQLCNVQVINAQ